MITETLGAYGETKRTRTEFAEFYLLQTNAIKCLMGQGLLVVLKVIFHTTQIAS